MKNPKIDDLERLSLLRSEGALTDEEFETEKRKIIRQRNASKNIKPNMFEVAMLLAILTAVFYLMGRAFLEEESKNGMNLTSPSDNEVPSNKALRSMLDQRSNAQKKIASEIPKVGECYNTKVETINSRPKGIPQSGVSLVYRNGIRQTSYDENVVSAKWKIGDDVSICVTQTPSDCPPGDIRGIYYKTRNHRTNEIWEALNAQHMCGD